MIFHCADLAVPPTIMQHIVKVESSGNPYAIGVVGNRLQRQPKTLSEAVATAKMLEQKGYNFSLGLAQVNRYNLKKYGLKSYEQAFQICPNIQAGSHILKECYDRAKDWGKSFSCYYSGNFVTGYRHGYVQKIFASMRKANGMPAKIVSNTQQPRPKNNSNLITHTIPTNAKHLAQKEKITTKPQPNNSNLTIPEKNIVVTQNHSDLESTTAKAIPSHTLDSAFVF